MRPNQNAGSVRVTQKAVECGQLMIRARPHEPKRQYQRRGYPGQAFFKIGAVLFREPKQSMGRQHGTHLGIEGIKIPNNRIWCETSSQHVTGATICGHQPAFWRVDCFQICP